MNGTIYQRMKTMRISGVSRKRQRFATILSIIMLAVYIGFILPDRLRARLGWARR